MRKCEVRTDEELLKLNTLNAYSTKWGWDGNYWASLIGKSRDLIPTLKMHCSIALTSFLKWINTSHSPLSFHIPEHLFKHKPNSRYRSCRVYVVLVRNATGQRHNNQTYSEPTWEQFRLASGCGCRCTTWWVARWQMFVKTVRILLGRLLFCWAASKHYCLKFPSEWLLCLLVVRRAAPAAV